MFIGSLTRWRFDELGALIIDEFVVERKLAIDFEFLNFCFSAATSKY
jgi:hypothetical protein